MKIYRHGDVLLKQVKKLPDGLKQRKDNVLAEGEVTGHFHKLVSRQKLVFEDNQGNKFVDVKQKTKLVHQEHAQLEIDAGHYAVVIEREFDPFEQKIRQVMD